MSRRCLILIPARMASTRLPGKPMADIAGYPMIIHVAKRAHEAKLGPVFVATDSEEIRDIVTSHGFDAIMTDRRHESGSDRIYEALMTIDPEGSFDSIVNLQGDLPTMVPQYMASAVEILHSGNADIATLCAEITEQNQADSPDIVKLVATPIAENHMRALYFTRARAPYGEGPLYHHIGLYAYRRDALIRYVALGPSLLERREKLEQLRALEAGMQIDAALVKTVPLGVDTAKDLEQVRHLFHSVSPC